MIGAVYIFITGGDISISESAFKGNSALGSEEPLEEEGGGMTCFNFIMI